MERLTWSDSCLSNGTSCDAAKSDLAVRATTHCEVPGTNTVLLIDPTNNSVFPFRMYQVLSQAQKCIRRKIQQEGVGNRPLQAAEIPFVSIAWGLRISAAPKDSPPNVSLTWQMLEDTITGILFCAYDERLYFDLDVKIMKESDAYLWETGSLMLQRVVAKAGDTA
ncbi:MAG: hypothetical protein Q9222_001008 [Ikaeria aurantiellina]